MMPSSLTKVHLKVCCSVLYGALLAAELFALRAPEALFSSTNTSVMKLFITDGLIGAHFRDQTTTPEVVTISKVSNIALLLLSSLGLDGMLFRGAGGSENGRQRDLIGQLENKQTNIWM